MPWVTVYEFNESCELVLRILRFGEPSTEWLRYVSSNRRNQPLTQSYDIVIGPVADDRTMPVISLYFAGVYDEAEAIRRLLPQKLKDQYAFKTQKALGFLAYKEEISV